jgi:Domain of unknown function (DUF6531)
LITISTAKLFEHDYATAGQNPLGFTRYYNSLGNSPSISTYATALGVNWRSTYDRYLHIIPPTGQAATVNAERAYPANDSLERDVAELMTRPVGGPSHKPVVWYKGLTGRHYPTRTLDSSRQTNIEFILSRE